MSSLLQMFQALDTRPWSPPAVIAQGVGPTGKGDPWAVFMAVAALIGAVVVLTAVLMLIRRKFSAPDADEHHGSTLMDGLRRQLAEGSITQAEYDAARARLSAGLKGALDRTGRDDGPDRDRGRNLDPDAKAVAKRALRSAGLLDGGTDGAAPPRLPNRAPAPRPSTAPQPSPQPKRPPEPPPLPPSQPRPPRG